MNDYYESRFNLNPCNEDFTDYLAASLADVGYESFVPDANGLTAYIPAALFSEQMVETVVGDLPFDTSVSHNSVLVKGQDWNAEWEKNYFKPIIVDDLCVIHSSFHNDYPAVQYDIVIDPKMAFGTGHHATTSLIISQLLHMQLDNKSVIDMGTGTGILAILAAMRGASPVTGIEIDEFAYENAIENKRLNAHEEIKLINGDASALSGIEPCDVFIANINRNIITADLKEYVKALKPGGTMLLSGFYEHDIPVVMDTATSLRLTECGHTVKGKDNWTCLVLKKM